MNYCCLALAKDGGNDEDMVEMISYEIDSLSKQLAELEDQLKVCFVFNIVIALQAAAFFKSYSVVLLTCVLVSKV